MTDTILKKYPYFLINLLVIFLYFFTESNILKNILLIIFFTELSFLIIYYIKRRKLYRFIKHPSLNDLFVETHPNLTFVTKPNFVLKVDENLEINKMINIDNQY